MNPGRIPAFQKTERTYKIEKRKPKSAFPVMYLIFPAFSVHGIEKAGLWILIALMQIRVRIPIFTLTRIRILLLINGMPIRIH
jgi:hypothetical protein